MSYQSTPRDEKQAMLHDSREITWNWRRSGIARVGCSDAAERAAVSNALAERA